MATRLFLLSAEAGISALLRSAVWSSRPQLQVGDGASFCDFPEHVGTESGVARAKEVKRRVLRGPFEDDGPLNSND